MNIKHHLTTRRSLLSRISRAQLLAPLFVFFSCATGIDAQQATQVQPTSPITLNCVRPPYLQKGDKVALISPSYATPMENVEKTAQLLRTWGLEPVIGPNVGKTYVKQYAGTDEERLSDLKWGLGNKDVKAIICNRGGYGSIHLIDKLSPQDVSASPKWLVGFSDITTYHGMFARDGVMSVHGTMSSFLAKGGEDLTSTLMRDLLYGKVPRYELPAHPQNITGRAQGVLVGGNLCTFVPNLHTSADATMADNIILFVEEVGESMHNIDRQIRVLELNGVLSRCRGIVLGEFTSCGSEFTYESTEAMLREIFQKYNIPVLCGFPGGHGDINYPLIMGAPVTIDVRNDGATLSFDIDGEQSYVDCKE